MKTQKQNKTKTEQATLKEISSIPLSEQMEYITGLYERLKWDYPEGEKIAIEIYLTIYLKSLSNSDIIKGIPVHFKYGTIIEEEMYLKGFKDNLKNSSKIHKKNLQLFERFVKELYNFNKDFEEVYSYEQFREHVAGNLTDCHDYDFYTYARLAL